MVPDGLVEDMKRGKIPLLGATLFRPPGFAKDVRHPAEVFARIPARGPRVEKAVDLLLSAGQEVHHDQQIGKVESCIPRVQRLEKAASHIQPLPELLPTLDAAVPLSAEILRRPAGKAAPRLLFGLHGDGQYFHGFLHHQNQRRSRRIPALTGGTGRDNRCSAHKLLYHNMKENEMRDGHTDFPDPVFKFDQALNVRNLQDCD